MKSTDLFCLRHLKPVSFAQTSAKDVWKAYKEFCFIHGYNLHSSKDLGNTILKHFTTKRIVNPSANFNVTWKGISLI